MTEPFESPAFDAVCGAQHPSDEQGGPCATCAFRPGTEANQTVHTVMLAKFCVEGVTPFDCHEHPRYCRGWIAAVNAKAFAGDISDDEDSKRWRECSRMAAEVLASAIAAGKAADEAARAEAK